MCDYNKYLEIQNAKASGKPFRDQRYVDVYREKQIRLVVKVIVPVKDHPKFNFVGKLLGPKGNSMRRLQEETLCKMAILGRGSMKDKKKVGRIKAIFRGSKSCDRPKIRPNFCLYFSRISAEFCCRSNEPYLTCN